MTDKSRGALWAASGLVVVALVAGGAFLLASGDDGPSSEASGDSGRAPGGDELGESNDPDARNTSGSSPTPDQSVGDYPNEIESTLLAHVPAEFREGCGRSESGLPPAATAAIICTPAGVKFVGYVQYQLASDMNRDFQSTRKQHDVQSNSGFCAVDESSEGTWNRGGRDLGRLLCYLEEGEARMDWTSDDLAVYAFAGRADGDQEKLFNFWVNAGPFGREL